MNEIEEFKRYLTEMLERADKSVPAEILKARMWSHFLPEAINLWTISGVLEQIAAQVAPPIQSDNDDTEN